MPNIVNSPLVVLPEFRMYKLIFSLKKNVLIFLTVMSKYKLNKVKIFVLEKKNIYIYN